MVSIRQLVLGVLVSAAWSAAPGDPPIVDVDQSETVDTCDICIAQTSGGEWFHAWGEVPGLCDTPEERQENSDCTKCTENCSGSSEGDCPDEPCSLALELQE